MADYLAAVAATTEAADVCPFVSSENEVAAVRLAESLADKVADAGGADAIEVRADDTLRMGATHVVVATSGDTVVHTFVVGEEDDHFLLLPEMNAP